MKPTLKALLRGLSGLFFVVAGLAFWVGGRAISEFAKIDRILGEMLGLALAGAFAVFGLVAKTLGEPDESGESANSTSGLKND